jgi:ATP dependent DNA ligase C terminal region
MLKVKRLRNADCVVGGFRYATSTSQVGSLLLGLYDDEGRLNHVGFTSSISDADRSALTARLEGLTGGPGFTGDAPGAPSRWSTERSADWQPLRAELVVEVSYDQVTDGRFRHGAMLLRWRPDKAPKQCTREQLQQELRPGRLVDPSDPFTKEMKQHPTCTSVHPPRLLLSARMTPAKGCDEGSAKCVATCRLFRSSVDNNRRRLSSYRS